MAEFTVRVELHSPDSADYDVFYEAMAEQGFTDIVRGETGKKKLPPAEYSYTGQLTMQQVREKAKIAAGFTTCECSILVTESAGRCWYNLDPV